MLTMLFKTSFSRYQDAVGKDGTVLNNCVDMTRCLIARHLKLKSWQLCLTHAYDKDPAFREDVYIKQNAHKFNTNDHHH